MTQYPTSGYIAKENEITILKRYVCVLRSLSCVQLFATPWTVASQAPLFMGLSRQEYWSGLPCPPPGDLPDPRIKPTSLVSPALQEDSLPLIHCESPEKILAPPYSFQHCSQQPRHVFRMSL